MLTPKRFQKTHPQRKVLYVAFKEQFPMDRKAFRKTYLANYIEAEPEDYYRHFFGYGTWDSGAITGVMFEDMLKLVDIPITFYCNAKKFDSFQALTDYQRELLVKRYGNTKQVKKKADINAFNNDIGRIRRWPTVQKMCIELGHIVTYKLNNSDRQYWYAGEQLPNENNLYNQYFD